MERETLILQQAHGAHRAFVRATPAAGTPVGIVKVGWAVDAEPDSRSRSGKEADPILVQQQSVGLEAMRKLQTRRAALGHERGCVLIPSERNDKRFSAVPRHLQLPIKERALEYTPANEVQRLQAHSCRRPTVGQVTVRVVDVAKRRRLQNEQSQARRRSVNASIGKCGHGAWPSQSALVSPLCN